MMKSLFATALALVISHCVFAQCTPNSIYQNDTLGFYPQVSEECGFTFKSRTDTVINIQGVGQVTLYLDAFKVTVVNDLPSGISVTSDVIGTADGAAPFGYWFNSGTVPTMSAILGCMSFLETGTTFASLASGGPNNDGNFPITLMLDARIAGSNPDISFLIANGTWMSNIPANLGGGLFPLERTLSVNSCLSPGPCTPPTVLFAGLNSSYVLTDLPSTLVGAPSGGTFYGPGISGNEFDPSDAGIGTHGITYVYTDNLNCTNAYSLCTTVDLTVGSPDGDLQSIGAEVYPNPSNGEFNISVPEKLVNSSYSIYNIDGSLVEGGMLLGSNTAIDLKGIKTGAYSVVINSIEGMHTQQVIIE